jgi:hypothetical protein
MRWCLEEPALLKRTSPVEIDDRQLGPALPRLKRPSERGRGDLPSSELCRRSPDSASPSASVAVPRRLTSKHPGPPPAASLARLS